MHKLYGQTIGKKFMGIKVVGIKKNNMDFLQVLIRDLFVFLLVYFTITIRAVVFFIPQINLIGATLSRYTIIYISSEIITAFLNKEGRAIHDLVANTVVVTIEKKCLAPSGGVKVADGT